MSPSSFTVPSTGEAISIQFLTWIKVKQKEEKKIYASINNRARAAGIASAVARDADEA